jgi:hypothetical protein
MKTTSAVLALLLLASPLMAAMGTYTTSTFKTGTTDGNKIGWAKDGDDKVKFLVQFAGLTDPTDDTDYCVVVGVPASGSTADNWNGADVGLYPISYTKTGTVWATAAPEDNSCTTKTTGECQLLGKETTNNAWTYASTASTDADKVAYATKTLSLEGARTIAAKDNAADLAVDKDTTKLLVGYLVAECPTDKADVNFADNTFALITGLTSPWASTSGSGSSFGALTYLSWVALLISYALLN